MERDPRLAILDKKLQPLRDELLDHPIYVQLRSLEHLRRFMELHVYAVWDFMSLLKAVQQAVCSCNVPWTPPVNAMAARFINEIVLAEESDDDGNGGFASHFELYTRAMDEAGADLTTISEFVERINSGKSLRVALAESHSPLAARQFVLRTFDTIDQGDLCAIVSAFTYGREDLLPGLFQQVVDHLHAESGQLAQFQYYLERHIELDGDNHGPMACRLILDHCGDDDQRWQRVENAALSALKNRKNLWDGMLESISGVGVPSADSLSEAVGAAR